MTVLSRALIRRMIIQEMRKPPLTSGLSFNDDDTYEIDRETEIDDIPSFMDTTEIDSGYIDFDDETEFDYDAAIGGPFDFDYDEDSETEDEDSESETEYNQFGQLGMSAEEIRRHVMSQAAKLAPDMRAKNRRTRAEMEYDKLVSQGREAEMPDPEFLNTDEIPRYEDTIELPPRGNDDNDLQESIRRRIKQSIRRQILLL